jgi:hypothetical protein
MARADVKIKPPQIEQSSHSLCSREYIYSIFQPVVFTGTMTVGKDIAIRRVKHDVWIPARYESRISGDLVKGVADNGETYKNFSSTISSFYSP